MLVVLLFGTLLTELLAYNFAKYFKNNNIVYQFFTPFEYLIYTLFYIEIIKSEKLKKIIKISFYLFLLISIISALLIQTLNESNTYTITLECYLIVALSLILFVDIRNNLVYQNILKEEIFWINSAIFIFYSINIIIWDLRIIKAFSMKDAPEIIFNSLILLLCFLLYITFAISILRNAHRLEAS